MRGVVLAVLLATGMVAGLTGCARVQRPVTKIVNGRVIVTRPISPQAYEHVTRALLYEEEERWEEAAQELQRAIPFDREAAELRAHLAELFIKLKRLDDAAEQAARSLKIEPTVDGWMASAHVKQARGDMGGAVQELRRAVAIAMADEGHLLIERAHLELADAQVVALDIGGAWETSRQLIRHAPETVRGRVEHAALGWALGKLAEAEAVLKEALVLEPVNLDVRLLLAQLQVAAGRIPQAKASFRETMDRAEVALEIAEAYAGWLTSRGEQAEAVELAEKLAAEGGDADSLQVMSRLERAAKRPERAKALAEKALKVGAPAGRVAILLALAAQDSGDKRGAVATLLGVSKEAPEHLEARLRAAEILREEGKVDEAMKALADVGQAAVGGMTAAEVEGQVAIARSLIDEKRGDSARAARRLDEALTKNPGDARLLMARAGVEERRGDWKHALAFAQRVLDKDPRSVEALNFLGFIAAEHAHELPRALKRLQSAMALSPGSAGIIDSVGWAYFQGGDLDRAGFFLEQAGRLEPADPEILEHLGDLYARRQDRKRALETYRKALSLSPSERLLRELQERVRTLEAKSAAGR
jgi:tetratricopeptide (TPR) repeat protein